MANQIQISSLDHDQRKLSLISFLKGKETFEDFDYEGSAINTLIDLLVYDDTYTAVLANMIANESFADTAKVRSNVVSHATKKSYVPRSVNASTMTVDIRVTPSSTVDLTNYITIDENTTFLTKFRYNYNRNKVERRLNKIIKLLKENGYNFKTFSQI